MWECGLKPKTDEIAQIQLVTPHVGVWIETLRGHAWRWQHAVTPHVGVWLETSSEQHPQNTSESLPMWECGLKHLVT